MDETIIVIVFISTFFYSLANVVTKIMISYYKSPFKLMFYQVTFYIIPFSVIYFIFLLIDSTQINYLLNVEYISLIFLSGVFTFVGGLFFFYGLSVGHASVSGVVQSSRVVVSIIFAIILFSEIYSPIIYGWILIIFLGVLLVSYDDSIELKDLLLLKSKGLIWFILATVSWSIGNVFVRSIEGKMHVLSVMFVRIIFIWIFIIFSFKKLSSLFNQEEMIEIKGNRDYLNFLLYAGIFIVADFLFVYAIGQNLTLPETVYSFNGIFSFILIIVLSKSPILKNNISEQLTSKILILKTTGIIIATIGILGLFWFV